MTATHAHAGIRPRRVLAGLAGGTLLALAVGATAQAATTNVVPRSAGLTAPAGMVQTPDGAVWVSDELRGVCQVDPASAQPLVESEYCSAMHVGPDAPTGLAFDPVSNSIYAADIASGSGAVWRLHWDPDTRTIDSATPIARLGDDRATAVALVPGATPAARPDVIFATKRSSAIMRVNDPAGTPHAPQPIGFANHPAAPSLASLAGKVYIAEGDGVSALTLGASTRIATPVTGLPGGLPSAVTADPQRGRLYVGTTNPGLDDEVQVLDVAQKRAEVYARGFTGVSAMTVDATGTTGDGDLMVADDPGAALAQLDAEGQGRLYRVGLGELDLPAARILTAPAAIGGVTWASFTFTPGGDASQCRLDGAAWVPCPDGSMRFEGLADGAHRFEVRPQVEAGSPGHPAARTFVVDTRAPKVSVAASPARDAILGERVSLDLVADEAAVDFACRIDDGAAEPCEGSSVLTGLSVGEHVVTVLGTDPAGNVSDPQAAPATRRIRVVAPPKAPAPAATPATDAQPAPAPAADLPVPAASGPLAVSSRVLGATLSAPKPLLAPVRLSPVRLQAPRRGGRLGRLELSFRAPVGARTARIALLRAMDNSGAAEVAVRNVAIRPEASNRIAFRLTRAESRRVRPGLHLVSVALGSSPGRMGNTQLHWLRIRGR